VSRTREHAVVGCTGRSGAESPLLRTIRICGVPPTDQKLSCIDGNRRCGGARTVHRVAVSALRQECEGRRGVDHAASQQVLSEP